MPMVQRRSPFYAPAAGTVDPARQGYHRERPASSGSADDIHPGVSEGNRAYRRHQGLASGKGASDHRSQNRGGREYPMVQRRPSLYRERTGAVHQAGESYY